MLEKIKKKGIDLFILVVNEDTNGYIAEDFRSHADYNSYKLMFTFEDWSRIINDGKEHLYIVAEYVNADDVRLVKFQDEDFDRLLDKVREWNKKHLVVGNRNFEEKFA